MDRFTAALTSHDLDATVALVTDAIVFEPTSPPPDGTDEGRDAVRPMTTATARSAGASGSGRQRISAWSALGQMRLLITRLRAAHGVTVGGPGSLCEGSATARTSGGL
jgi:ketosteroid isomerase-like protein